jgi:hypothetical protein
MTKQIYCSITKEEQKVLHQFCSDKGIKVGDFCFQAIKDTMKRMGTNIKGESS